MEQKKFIQTRPKNYTFSAWIYRLLNLQFILFVCHFILGIISSLIATYSQIDAFLISSFVFIIYWCAIVFYFFFIKIRKPSMVPGDLSLEFEEDTLKLINKGTETLIPYGDITSITILFSKKGDYHAIKLKTDSQTCTLNFFIELETIMQLLSHKVSNDCPILIEKVYIINTYRGGLFNLFLGILNINLLMYIFLQRTYLPIGIPFWIGILIYLLSFLPRKCVRSIPISYRPLPSSESFKVNKNKEVQTSNRKRIILHKVFISQVGLVLALPVTKIILFWLDAQESYILIGILGTITVILLVFILLTLYQYYKNYLISSDILTVNEEGITFTNDVNSQTYEYKDFIKVKAYMLKSGKFLGILCRTTTKTFVLSEFEDLEMIFEHFKLRLPNNCSINSQKLLLSSMTSFKYINLLLFLYNLGLFMIYIIGILMPISDPETINVQTAAIIIMGFVCFLILKPRTPKTVSKTPIHIPKIYIFCALLLLAAILFANFMS